jgi:signal transduction histidine kinase
MKFIQEYDHAQALLSQRQFVNAMSCAQIVLEESFEAGGIDHKIAALLLIVDINNTQGRYQSNSELYRESLEYLENGYAFLADSNKGDSYWELRLKKAETFLLLAKYKAANDILERCMEPDALSLVSQKTNLKTLLIYSEYHYLQNEYDIAVHYIEMALDGLEGDTDSKLCLEVYSQAARVYLRRHEYGKIYEFGAKTLELSKTHNDSEKEFIGLNAIAVYYGTKYDFKMAMLYFRNALDKSKEIDYRYGIAYCLINIGTIYANLFNYNEALDRYTKVLEKYEDSLDDNTGLIILNNIGNIYYTVGKLDEALDYFERSLVLAESIQYTEMLAHTMAQISRTLVAQKRYEEALDYAFKSEALIEESGNEEGKQINYITLGNIYYRLGDHNLAMKYVGKGIVSSKRVKDSVSEIRGYRLMSNIFQEKGNFEKALDYQLIYSQAQERYAMEQRNRQIIDIEIRYDFQQKEKEVELLERYKDKLLSQRDTISAQNEKLTDANKDLMQFAYAVSHDLKEPLRMIGSYSQLIQRRYTVNLDDSSNEFFGYVNEGVSRMSKLLDDLLKYAVIGRDDNHDWEEVSLHEVLEVTLFNLQLIIEESKANIIFNELSTIETNRAYMSQLFQNLISNAIKFTKKNQTPEITIHYKEIDNQHQISFQDNGIGIPAEAVGRIFVIFQRLHKRSGYEGTGIGLSICMKIIERLGGSISVESEEGVGSKFTILLPMTPP